MAMDVGADVEVARPASEVFDYLADGENMPRWMKAFTAVEKVGDGPIGPGTEFRYLDRRGHDSTFEWAVFRPNSELVWHGDVVRALPGGSFEPEGSVSIQEHEGHTHVEMRMQPRLYGTAKLLRPMLSRGMRRSNDEYMRNLKDVLEQ